MSHREFLGHLTSVYQCILVRWHWRDKTWKNVFRRRDGLRAFPPQTMEDLIQGLDLKHQKIILKFLKKHKPATRIPMKRQGS